MKYFLTLISDVGIIPRTNLGTVSEACFRQLMHGGYRQTRTASGWQAASDNQIPAHSCRPVHTGVISKRLARVTRKGSLLERLYRLTLGKREGKSCRLQTDAGDKGQAFTRRFLRVKLCTHRSDTCAINERLVETVIPEHPMPRHR